MSRKVGGVEDICALVEGIVSSRKLKDMIFDDDGRRLLSLLSKVRYLTLKIFLPPYHIILYVSDDHHGDSLRNSDGISFFFFFIFIFIFIFKESGIKLP